MIKKSLDFLAALNLTIFVLAAIAVLVIVQEVSGWLYKLMKDWSLLELLGSKNIYQSQLFYALLVLFCINLLACSLKRLPKTISAFRSSTRVLDDSLMISLPIIEKTKTDDYEGTKRIVFASISGLFKKPLTIKNDNRQILFYAEKGRYAHAGFYLAHLGILLTVIGAMLSSVGFEYSFNMQKAQLLDPLVVKDRKATERTLDFSLRCDEIEAVYHPGSTKVKKHQTKLTILENGREIKTETINLSRPLIYRGTGIYQQRYLGKKNHAAIEVAAKGTEPQIFRIRDGGKFVLKDSGIGFKAMQFKPDAVQLRNSSTAERIWVATEPVSFAGRDVKAYKFSLIDIHSTETTMLRAVKDPGRQLIWFSFFVMVIGFSITSFWSHQRLWAKVEDRENLTLVTLAGSATKNLQAVKEVIVNIKTELEERDQHS